MKKTNIILSFVICILSYGCTDLSETVYTGVAMNDFFKNEKELVANAGRAYTKLQEYNSEQSLWTLLLQASDECAVPACGGSWYSNGRYEEIQTNKIPPANKLLTRGWNWIFNGIAACNEISLPEVSPISYLLTFGRLPPAPNIVIRRLGLYSRSVESTFSIESAL